MGWVIPLELPPVVTGAAGGVLLRPFARLIASSGDSVTTAATAWNMN